ncbi:Endoglucanase 7 [Hordeum vulgare]|nr:Endoglucanase 7 [Hordeum vulgare]
MGKPTLSLQSDRTSKKTTSSPPHLATPCSSSAAPPSPTRPAPGGRRARRAGLRPGLRLPPCRARTAGFRPRLGLNLSWRASYLDYVVDNAHKFGGTGWAISEFSWDVKYAGVQILATRLLLRGEHEERHRATLQGYRAKAEHYLCACMGKNAAAEDNVERSPGGMLYVRQWNNMQYVTSAAFLLSVYSGYLAEGGEGATPSTVTCVGGASAGAGEVFAHARTQVEYVLGSNPRRISYLVGYGTKFPARVHHRAASIVR